MYHQKYEYLDIDNQPVNKILYSLNGIQFENIILMFEIIYLLIVVI